MPRRCAVPPRINDLARLALAPPAGAAAGVDGLTRMRRPTATGEWAMGAHSRVRGGCQ